MLRVAMLVLSVVIFITVFIPVAREADELRLVRIGSMERVAETGDVTDRGAIRLFAARGETEPFQFVVSARGGALSGVSFEISDLSGPNGAIIPATSVVVYREHYVSFKTGSPRAPLPPGSYPDALIPLRNPYTGEDPSGVKYDCAPFDLADGGNQPIWVDVLVPRDAAPGDYSGSIVIRASGGLNAKLSYKLTVWDFDIPLVPAMKSHFGAWRVEEYYGLERWTNRYYTISRRYADALIDHRLAIGWAGDMQLDAKQDGSLVFVKNVGDLGSSKDIFEYYMKQRGMSALSFPLWQDWPFEDPLGADRQVTIAWLRNFIAFADKGGWGDRLYLYMIDEPNDAKAYEEVRRWGALMNEAGARFKFLVTEQPKPDNPAWGSLVGYVDIWCPLSSYLTMRQARERLAAGDELWTYTALVQDNFSPKWQLDHLPIEYRLYPWIARCYGITGLLYWETTYWEESDDPWTKASSIYHRYVGDGQLLYPGTVATVGFDGPVASMRLKWIREGMDDYDYIAILKSLGQEKFLERRAGKVAASWADWTADGKLLLTVRNRMGRRIERLLSK
jgi:hypothetical protein